MIAINEVDVEYAMHNHTDLISVIMPVYNGAAYIKEAIESVLNQSYPNFELIIVNDGSIDDTKYIVNNFLMNPKIKYYEYEENKGKVHAINLGYKNSNGNYICLLASDDVLLPDSLITRLEYIKKYPKLSAVFSNCFICNANLEIQSILIKSNKSIEIINFSNSMLEIIYNNFIGGGLILFKKEVAENIFPIPEELKFEDWWIAFNLILNGFKILFINKPLLYYRIHINNDNGYLYSKNVENKIKKDYLRHYQYYNYFIDLINKSKILDIIHKQKYIEAIKAIQKAKLKCTQGKFYYNALIFIKYFGIKRYIIMILYSKNIYYKILHIKNFYRI
jgi:glycosyltransferase involved in cell wall biosynthesis